MKNHFYILNCSDNKYYYGSTTNLEKRIIDHNWGKVCSTSKRLPIKLVYTEEFASYRLANNREHEVKSWKDRDRVEKLIYKARSSNG